MAITRRVVLLSGILLLGGCAEQGPPQRVQDFPGATNVIAPATGYYLNPPEAGPVVYYLNVPEPGQEPDGQLNPRQRLQIVEQGGDYAKIRIGGDLGTETEAFVEARFVPDGEFAAGTKVAVLEVNEAYVKVKTIDEKEVYVKPFFIKRIAPEG